MRVLPGASAYPLIHSPGFPAVTGEFQVTVAAVTVASAARRLASVPMMFAAPFQFAAAFTPAVSVAPMAGAATSVPPLVPPAGTLPPMKSMLMIT